MFQGEYLNYEWNKGKTHNRHFFWLKVDVTCTICYLQKVKLDQNLSNLGLNKNKTYFKFHNLGVAQTPNKAPLPSSPKGPDPRILEKNHLFWKETDLSKFWFRSFHVTCLGS